MAARIIHLGWDDCYRLAVLRHAGYHVTEAGCRAELLGEVHGGDAFDAVLISEDPNIDLLEVLGALRKVTRTPVVLFRRSHCRQCEQQFDLLIDPLLPPTEWLPKLALVVARYRMRPWFGAGSPMQRAMKPSGTPETPAE